METKISKTTSTRKRSNLEQELVNLQQGQIILVTRDYLKLGIWKAKFSSAYKGLEHRGAIWAIPVDSADNLKDLNSVALYKPDWHTSPMDAWNQIITLTFREQVRLLEAQQRAAKQLFGDKD